MLDPTQSLYDQLHSRPKHPTVHVNPPPEAQLQPEHASSCSGDNVDLSLPPKRTHWLNDDLATNCMACGLKFSVFTRKHHCRKCGQIFCSECSKYTGKLDSNAQFNSYGYACRLCISCSQECTITLNGNSLSDNGLIDSPSLADLSTIDAQTSDEKSPNLESANSDQKESRSPIVPTDWQWSTF